MIALGTLADALDWLQDQRGSLTMDTLGAVEVRVQGIAYSRVRLSDSVIAGARVLVAVNSCRTQIIEQQQAQTNAKKGTRRSKR